MSNYQVERSGHWTMEEAHVQVLSVVVSYLLSPLFQESSLLPAVRAEMLRSSPEALVYWTFRGQVVDQAAACSSALWEQVWALRYEISLQTLVVVDLSPLVVVDRFLDRFLLPLVGVYCLDRALVVVSLLVRSAAVLLHQNRRQ